MPVHLIGWRLSLDRRAAGVRGAATTNPHGLVQEFLNRSEDHFWGIVSNGLQLRVLRDSQALSRQSYLEFDLETMFDGQVYSDFVLLWLIGHASRFAPRIDNRPDSCWLEVWSKEAQEQGARALNNLRGGVEQALRVLGQGLVSHPKNRVLRDALRSGSLQVGDFHGELLRIIYRLIFLFVAEDRDLDGISLLHPRDSSEASRLARERFTAHYSMRRLRNLATTIRGSRHGDLWRQFYLLTRALYGTEETASFRVQLALPALGSSLWDPDSTHDLNAPNGTVAGVELANSDFLEAIRDLAFTRLDKVLRPVDYRNLGSEEFGSVYESLLALTPQISGDGASFDFAEFAGNARKTSGSYYTPDALVQCLLDSALDPVVIDRIGAKKGKEAENALLSIKVCDPAVGSGHFLIGAARRMARHLARIRSLAEGEGEPSPDRFQHALRDVIGRCLYGVDLNPMALELCKFVLWLEALEPGKPLSFLGHHIQCGNSLLGVTPRALAGGLPDDAFKAIMGDDPETCKEAKARNKDERKQLALFHGTATAPWDRLGALPAAMLEVDTMSDETTAALLRKEERYGELLRSTDYLQSRFLADAWCAAFVWKKTRDLPYPITNDVLRKIERNPHDCAPWMREEIERLRDSYQFFHWHLAFPEVFPVPVKDESPDNKHTGWNGGFDVLLGNPPWERVKLQEKEWFAEKLPAIANAPNAAARKRLIQQLREESPQIFAAFTDGVRKADGEAQIMRSDELYPLCGCGDMNTYALFAERSYYVLSLRGFFGLVLPTGIVTGDTTKAFFGELMRTSRLRAFIGFDNEEKQIFPDIDNNLTFAAVVVGADTGTKPKFCFNIRRFNQLDEGDRFFELSAEDLTLLNPNTRTCPIFRSSADGELVRRIYTRLPLMWLEGLHEVNTWGVRFMTMFHMAGDSQEFVSEEQLTAKGAARILNRFAIGTESFSPLYEAKMIWHFEHRWAAFYGRELLDGRPSRKYVGWYGVRYEQPDDLGFGRYWVADSAIRGRIGLDVRYFVAFRDITNRDLERTTVFTVLPTVAVGHQAPMIFLPGKTAAEIACFVAERNSFAADYVARNKIDGSHLTYFVFKQLPVLPPAAYAKPCAWAGQPKATLRDWLLPRVLELTYTAWDLEPFARDCGCFGPPFVWDEARRFQLRCELDAAFFHLYGLNREDTTYVLDTFPIVRRKDEAAHGTFRTKNTILALYDQFAEAQRTGTGFNSPLEPPPGDLRACHPKRKLAILAFGSLRYDPGFIGKHIAFRIKTETPFLVEYGRLSNSRGGGPTLVPHDNGAKVEAELLVLPDDMQLNRARDLLWRRERRKEDSSESYSAGIGPNAVLVRETSESPWAETILYTDFNASGKVTLSADALAKAAVDSVASAPENKDGISYLMSAMETGIQTPLTEEYRNAILHLTGVDSLADALIVAKTGKRPVPVSTNTSVEAKPAKKLRKKVADMPAPAPELNLGLDIFGNVVAPARSWEDDVFAVPAELRHGVLPEDLYVRQWLHALFSLHPSGLTGSQVFDSFRLLLNQDSRKLIAQSGDKCGTTWLKAFDQPVQLTTFFASLLQRATDGEIEVSKVGSEVRLQRAMGWSESTSAWVRADAEITQRALRDQELRSQLLPFISPTPEVTTFSQALTKMAQ